MGTRRRARELVLQLLYQKEHTDVSLEEMQSGFEEWQNASDNVRGFADKLLRGTLEKMTAIDEELGHQTTHWRLERLAAHGEARRAPGASDERRRYYRVTALGRRVAGAEARRLERQLGAGFGQVAAIHHIQLFFADTLVLQQIVGLFVEGTDIGVLRLQSRYRAFTHIKCRCPGFRR